MIKPVLLTGLLLLAVACGPNEVDRPFVMDGQVGLGYSQDLASCRATAAEYRQEDLRRGAATGALIGAVAGAADDGSDDLNGALVGAAIGGLVGAAEASEELDTLRRQVIIRCLRGRGHPVIG